VGQVSVASLVVSYPKFLPPIGGLLWWPRSGENFLQKSRTGG
jgi:hypothetical protein